MNNDFPMSDISIVAAHVSIDKLRNGNREYMKMIRKGLVRELAETLLNNGYITFENGEHEGRPMLSCFLTALKPEHGEGNSNDSTQSWSRK